MTELRPDELLTHDRFLRRLALHLVGDPHAADDLAQETYAAALVAPAPPREGLRGWLGGVLRNRWKMRIRAAARRRRREDAAGRAERPGAATPDELAIRLETQEAVVRAVRELDEPYRRTIFLRFLDGRSTAEVARLTGVPASTVRSRQQRALALLRERLDGTRPGGRRAWSAALLPLVARSESVAAGVLLMSAKKTLAIVLVLAVVGVGWMWRRPSEPAPRRSAPTAPAAADRPAPAPADAPDGPRGDDDTPDRDRDLFGEVVDRAGTPVAGATVATIFRPFRRTRVVLAPAATVAGPVATTRADGRFRLRLRRGQLAELRVEAPGFPAVAVPRCQAGERVRIVLDRAATFRVVVRDPEGVPVAGEPVLLRATGARPGWRLRGVTRADGSFVFAEATAGPAILEMAGHHECRVPGSLDVVRPAGRTLTGTVRDAGTGAPLPGARVGNPFAGFAVETDELGRFEIRSWYGQGARELHAKAHGYGRLGRLVPAEGEVDFALTPGDEAAATVVAADGAPLAGVVVVAMGSRHTNGMQHVDTRHARTGDDGRFLLTDLRRDLPHTVIVQTPGHGKVFRDFDPHPGRPGRIELGTIRMAPPLRLEGRVLAADGAPLRGVTVTLEPNDRVQLDAYYASEQRRPDDLGRFRFPDLSAGRYDLVVARPDRRPLLRRTVALDRDTDDLVLRVDPGGTVSVRVVDRAGAPVPGVMADAGRSHGETGADGRVTLEGVPDGADTVKVWPGVPAPDAPRGFRPGSAPIRPDGGEIVVTLDETRPVRGRVLGADGSPLPRLVVAAVEPGTRTELVRAPCDDDGRFTVFVRPEQVVDLVVDGTRARSPHRHGIAETVDLYGETVGVRAPARDVTIRTGAMPTDRALTVVVLDPDGAPVAGAEVTVSNARVYPYDDPTARGARTDARGRARWTDLPRRQARVVAAAPSGLDAVVPRPATAWPAGQTLTLRFERGLEVEGLVVRADGSPAAGATVRVLTMHGQLLGTPRTGADGVFRFRARAGVLHQLFASLPAEGGRHHRAWRHNVDPEKPIRLELSAVPR